MYINGLTQIRLGLRSNFGLGGCGLAQTVLRHGAAAPLREDTGERYPTLNHFNESIVSGNENVWNGNWKYRTPEGAWRSIDRLRS